MHIENSSINAYRNRVTSETFPESHFPTDDKFGTISGETIIIDSSPVNSTVRYQAGTKVYERPERLNINGVNLKATDSVTGTSTFVGDRIFINGEKSRVLAHLQSIEGIYVSDGGQLHGTINNYTGSPKTTLKIAANSVVSMTIEPGVRRYSENGKNVEAYDSTLNLSAESELTLSEGTLVHNVGNARSFKLAGGTFQGMLNGRVNDAPNSTVTLTTGAYEGGIISKVASITMDGAVVLKPSQRNLLKWTSNTNQSSKTLLKPIRFDSPARITATGKPMLHKNPGLKTSPVVANEGLTLERGAGIELAPLSKDDINKEVAFLRVEKGLTLTGNNAVHGRFVDTSNLGATALRAALDNKPLQFRVVNADKITGEFSTPAFDSPMLGVTGVLDRTSIPDRDIYCLKFHTGASGSGGTSCGSNPDTPDVPDTPDTPEVPYKPDTPDTDSDSSGSSPVPDKPDQGTDGSTSIDSLLALKEALKGTGLTDNQTDSIVHLTEAGYKAGNKEAGDKLLAILTSKNQQQLARLADENTPSLLLNGVTSDARAFHQDALNAIDDRLYRIDYLDKHLAGVSTGDTMMNAPTMWLQYFHNQGDRYTTSDSLGFDSKIDGVILGFDTTLDDQFVLGVTGAYAQSKLNSKDISQTIKADRYQGGLYAQWNKGISFINATVNYGAGKSDVERTADSAFYSTKDVKHTTWGAKAGAGLDLPLNDAVYIRPEVKLNYVKFKQDGYKEDSTGLLAQEIKEFEQDAIELGVGIKAMTEVSFEKGALQPFVQLEGYHNFKDDRTETQYRLVNVGDLWTTVKGAEQEKNRVLAGAGVSYRLDQFTVGASYRYNWNGDFRYHNARLHVEYEF